MRRAEAGEVGEDYDPSKRVLLRLIGILGITGPILAAVRVLELVQENARELSALTQQAIEHAYEQGRTDGQAEGELEAVANSYEARRRRAFEELTAFEQAHEGEPITESLLKEFAGGPQSPVGKLFFATFGFITPLNNNVEIRLMERADFNRFVQEDSPETLNPEAVNGRTSISSLEGATIRIPNRLAVGTEIGQDQQLEGFVPSTIKDLRTTVMHEWVHAATIISGTYTPDGGSSINFNGLSLVVRIQANGRARVLGWNWVNEAAVNMLLLEMNLVPREETLRDRLVLGGPQGFSKMKSLMFLVEDVARMSILEFADQIYFRSNPLQATVILQRIIQKNFPNKDIDPNLIPNAFNLINTGDLVGFSSLIEAELGISPPSFTAPNPDV